MKHARLAATKFLQRAESVKVVVCNFARQALRTPADDGRGSSEIALLPHKSQIRESIQAAIGDRQPSRPNSSCPLLSSRWSGGLCPFVQPVRIRESARFGLQQLLDIDQAITSSDDGWFRIISLIPRLYGRCRDPDNGTSARKHQ